MATPDTLRQARWQNRPSARSVLLTVLGELVFPNDRAVATRSFLDILSLLGFRHATARQALARSAAGGWLTSARHGRETVWRLTPELRRVLAAGTERIYGFGRQPAPWRGEWLLLHVRVPDSRRDLRHRLHTRLAWAGFGTASAGLWISPDPRREAEARAIIEELGLTDRCFSLRGRASAIGSLDEIVRGAWDLGAIADRYQAFLERQRRRAPRSDEGRTGALIELVHDWRAFPFVDPSLPVELLPRRWIGTRAAARFHQLHQRWAPAARDWWRQRS